MAREILMSRAAVLRNGLIEKSITAREAAKECEINYSHFNVLLKADHVVTYRTAGKLREFFGEGAVEIVPANK